MSGRTIIVIVISFLLVPLDVKADVARKNSTLQIYLPREVSIEDEIVKLGQVGIIRGAESLVAKAGEITLGRFSLPGQELIVDRQTILSRLASSQMPSSQVRLKGAEKITVRRQQQTVSGADLVKQATSFLRKMPVYASVAQFNPVRMPPNLIIPCEYKDIKFGLNFVGNNTSNRAQVKVVVVADGKDIGMRQVSFRLKYNCSSAVTLAELDAGAVISPENVKIVKVLSDHPEQAGWKPPYGLVTRGKLGPNTVVGLDRVVTPPAEAVVKRNQNVVILIETPGLLITATGQAMQKGCVGEYIKVRNVDSRRLILAKVNADGTVQPAL